jgi:hypothetical protein
VSDGMHHELDSTTAHHDDDGDPIQLAPWMELLPPIVSKTGPVSEPVK